MPYEQIKKIYLEREDEIISRLKEFDEIWKNGNEEKIFAELAFCILTPQSKAKVCWLTIENIINKNLLLNGNKKQFLKELSGIRFNDRKADYIIEARKKFLTDEKLSIKAIIEEFEDVYQTRQWLVKNIKGIAYKESSHFLRNIGFSEHIVILDRHILKNLVLMRVIDKIPKSLSKKQYLKIENKMKGFAEKINIPLNHLDFVLWSKETGEIFK